MKKPLLITIMFLSGMTKLFSQTYPFWDSDNPGGGGNNDYNCISTNAVFRIGMSGGMSPSYDAIERWTPCGGWEELPGCTIRDIFFSNAHANRRMVVHDHYLYVAGHLFMDAVTNNPIGVARFDLNTGIWSPIGQGWDLTNREPWTIAVDSLDNIYVGFYEFGEGDNGFSSETGYRGQTLTNLLIVSSDNGNSWNTVGGGLVIGTAYLPGITALCATGTNIYIGGDFINGAGQANNSSRHVIEWAGNAWKNLDGVYSSAGNDYALDWITVWGLAEVNSIIGIGTNIYVTGVFDTPQSGIARFSTETGYSLPIDGLSANMQSRDWYFDAKWGSSLAVNNGSLYLAGCFITADGSATNYACLLDPEATHPTLWTNPFPASIDNAENGVEVSSVANGNALYVAAEDESFRRLMVAPDGASPSAQITDVSPISMSITGTPQSHWKIFCSYDHTTWYDFGSITLWNGTGAVDLSVFEGTPPIYWQVANNCASTIHTNIIINVQFAGYEGQTVKTDAAAVGFTGDYWNVVPTLTGEESPPGAYIECLNSFSNSSPISVSLDSAGDPPYGLQCGYAIDGIADAATDPLMQGRETEGSGADLYVQVLGLNSHANYDFYFYAVAQDGESRRSAEFQLLTNSCPDAVTSASNPQHTDSGLGWDINTWQEGKQYIVFRNVHFSSPNSGSVRNITFRCSGQFSGGSGFAEINGLQIVTH